MSNSVRQNALKLFVSGGLTIVTLIEPWEHVDRVAIVPPYAIPVSVARQPHVHGTDYPPFPLTSTVSASSLHVSR